MEKNMSCGEICPHGRFSCGQILDITGCHVDKFSTWQIDMWKNSPHMINVKKIWNVEKKCVQFMVFCCILQGFVANSFFCKLRCFVAKSVFVRFTRFCVEKNWAKNCTRGEKMTIMRYGLRHRVFSFSFSNPDLKIVTGTKATIQSFFSQIFMIQYYLLPSTGPVIVLSKCDLLLHPASIWMRLWRWVRELSRFFAAKSYSDKSRLFFTLYFRLCVCSAGYHATRQ